MPKITIDDINIIYQMPPAIFDYYFNLVMKDIHDEIRKLYEDANKLLESISEENKSKLKSSISIFERNLNITKFKSELNKLK
jgi:hypothetical protein